MKKVYFLLITLCLFTKASAQFVVIQDAVLKSILVSTNCVDTNADGIPDVDVDSDNDNEITFSEAEAVSNIYIDGNVTSLTGFDTFSFSNLTFLSIKNTSLTKIRLSNFSSLHELRINNNSQLRGLYLSSLTGLYTLDCSFNQIGTIQRDYTNNIRTFKCNNNNLTALNLANSNSLTSLDCSNNSISNLYVNRNNRFTTIEFNNNPPLTSICANSNDIALIQSKISEYGITNVTVSSTCSATAPCVTGAVCFDDAYFKFYILSNTTADSNFDGEIQFAEALQLTSLGVYSNVRSLATISYFTNLTDLTINNTQLTGTVDLTSLVNLRSLTVEWNHLFSTLKINNLTALETFVCNNNSSNLLNIQANGLTNLRSIVCTENSYLGNVYLTGAQSLLTVDFTHNNLNFLNLSDSPLLTSVKCDRNKIGAFTINSQAPLNYLNFGGNKVTTFDFTPFTNLQNLDCSSNLFQTVDFHGLNNLRTLNCAANKFGVLDVSYLPNLNVLDCSYSPILSDIFIKNNNSSPDLTSIGLAGNLNLVHICADPVDFQVIQNSLSNTTLVPITLDSNCNCVGPCSDAIVYIPDANFKAKLISASPTNYIARNLSGQYFKIDANSNNEIEVSEAFNVTSIDVPQSNIASMQGIESFVNLNNLKCYNNNLVSLNLSRSVNMAFLQCQTNRMTSLNISGLKKIQHLTCSGNQLTSLDLSEMTALNYLHCTNNLLNILNIKNGIDETQLYIVPNTTLRYVCADESQVASVQSQLSGAAYANCSINSYCSFTPGGKYFTLRGNNKLDINNNGCDAYDIPFQNMRVEISSPTAIGSTGPDNNGNYQYYVKAGTHIVIPFMENPTYFNVTPTTASVTFLPTDTVPFVQDFCFSPNGNHPDLEVIVIPINIARPGFDAKYKIIYKNKGNIVQSGVVDFYFNDDVLDFVMSNPAVSIQSADILSWNFVNLNPFETREIAFSLNVNTPMEDPAVNDGDVLEYTTTIASTSTDDMPDDNIFEFDQTVVNSHDPNDKTCLEGATISPSEVGKYVHYMIRFENTGTYQAENIVVKDMIDTDKFDINSIVPIKGSHPFVTNITSGNKVEFIFENINLPFDDANNDGYVVFKIKTKPTLVNGDTFSNSASIYFDYNFPIITNTATTTIQSLSIKDFEFGNYFALYPNPVDNILNIETKQTIAVSSISIYNQLGQLVLVVANAQNVKTVDVSNLSAGNYFIKINSDKGVSNAKFIKK